MDKITFDRGACHLIKWKCSLSGAFGEPEKKVAKSALIGVNRPRIFRGETCLLIRLYPRTVCFDLLGRYGLDHVASFSLRIFSSTSFCRSFVRSTLSEDSILSLQELQNDDI